MDTREGDTNANTGGEMGEAAIESDGTDVFVIYDGKRIAKRGHPDTPQAGTWVSIEPGYTVCGTRTTRKSLLSSTRARSSAVENHGGNHRRSAAPYRTPHVRWRLNSSGSLAMFAAIRRASN